MTGLQEKGFRVAVERAGSIAALARLCGVTRSAVKQWEAEGLVPVPRRRGETNRVLLIERELGVHRHLLNPVVYPEPPSLHS
jgi:DNA-binding transcriptional regulator YdaS (Cro superfamily)